MIYESYNLPKQSPTVALFMVSDYIKFISNLKEYISLELTFIRPEESRWKKQICGDNCLVCYAIGVIKDIEIFFLHYHSKNEAKNKWEPRCKRINWDRMIVNLTIRMVVQKEN